MFYYLLTDLSCADLSFFDKTDREFIDQLQDKTRQDKYFIRVSPLDLQNKHTK